MLDAVPLSCVRSTQLMASIFSRRHHIDHIAGVFVRLQSTIKRHLLTFFIRRQGQQHSVKVKVWTLVIALLT